MVAGGAAGADLVRRSLSWVLPAAAVGCVVAASAWWWDLPWPMAMLQPAYPAVILPILLVLAVAALRRRWVSAGVALLAGVVAGVAVVPTLIPGPQPPEPPGHPGASRLTVMALNTYFGQADLNSVQRAVQDHGVDVLILSEAGPQVTPYVRGGGIGKLLPYDSGPTRGEASGTLILSRLPLRVIDNDMAGDRHQQPLVELRVGGRSVLVRGVHTISPSSRRQTSMWRDDLAQLGGWQQGVSGPLVMAGDFNAAWPHPGFREAAAGLDDALRARGRAWSPTWNYLGSLPPFTQIDHVLTRGFVVHDAATLVVSGTDHAGIVTTLELTP